jgi:hypothetical protein
MCAIWLFVSWTFAAYFEGWVIDRRTFKSTLEKSADDIVKDREENGAGF